MAAVQRKVYVYTYNGKCFLSFLLTPLMKLVAFFVEVRFERKEGSWLSITIPKIRIDQTSCQR